MKVFLKKMNLDSCEVFAREKLKHGAIGIRKRKPVMGKCS